ncbi:hypothetical protein P691DRAFT_758126 [Macrolepiota fuliginosa MF-IS2]|uniref:Nephrocystin 3-like N-terminal domain-containing protein n=1 Tax=Macrolepiota fuliginosa MF-IS2 TaxID=1400762 RepID=A0A9P5XFI8_9AGAR|nr:hypothetical protein P691DRAFT_758126 [Macrolepiota fuliginosa MF-IS2]
MSNGGILQGAHHLILYNPNLNDNSTNVENHINQVIYDAHPYQRGPGLRELLRASMPDAFHDSSVRDPPPSCHPDTRDDDIATITSWGLGASQHAEGILWIYGPAGVGKSAVVQTCAERLAEKNKLGSALFFSRSVGSN